MYTGDITESGMRAPDLGECSSVGRKAPRCQEFVVVKSARTSMMWAIHVRMGVTPRNLVASIFALNVREARHIAITSSMIQQVCMCVRMYSYVKQQTCISAPETRARPKTDPQEVHWVEHNSTCRAHARIHKFLRTSLKFWSLVCLMTYMRSNAPALAPGRRAQGRKPTPKRVRTWARECCTVHAGRSSETQVHMRALVQNPHSRS